MHLRLALLLVLCAAAALAGCGGSSSAPPPASLRPVAAGAPIPAGRMPVGLAVGDGTVWVVDGARGALLRIDAASRRPEGAPISVGRAPFAVAVGAGSVWVVTQPGLVREIDPVSGKVVGEAVRVEDANGLAVGLGGVWVTSRIAGTVTRIDPRTHRADRPIRVGAGAADVVVADGSVWVANAAAGTVSQIAEGRAREPIDVGGEVLALAAGAGGVWVARALGEFAQETEVVRIDPGSRELGRAVSVPGAIPLDLAAGDAGVWATDVGGLRPPSPERPGSLTRIDPGRDAVTGRPIELAGRPVAVATGAGATWVADAAGGTVTPIAAR